MAKKAAKTKSHKTKSATSRKYVVHKKLEEPVHNLVGYGALLALVIAVFALISMLKSFGML